jgi:peptidoglycan/xylan/chitin deacetylase (PgdA/CDA1 family)
MRCGVRAILTFHSIDNSGSVLSYPPTTFRRLLDALEHRNLPVLDLDTLLLAETKRGIALTFDDGIRTVFTEALPILRAHGVPAHLFLTTGVIGETNRWRGQPASAPVFTMLQWSEIEALQKGGIRIEAHTVNHPDLRQLSEEALLEECEAAEQMIAARLGRTPYYFAYPYGSSNARVRNFARSRYRGSLTTDLRPLSSEEDLAALPRLDSYYFRHHMIFGNLEAPRARALLGLRRVLRQLKAKL